MRTRSLGCTKALGNFLCIVWVAATPLAAKDPVATEPFVSVTTVEKAKIFTHRVIGLESLGKSLVTAGIAQWGDIPHEWGQGMEGYGKRYGNKIATRGCENGIGMLGAYLLKEDPRYFRSGQEGVWRRTRHAITHTFRTRKDNGTWTWAEWRLAGNFGAQFISNAWRPPSQNSPSKAFARGVISIGYDTASNIFKEFWPDIRRRVLKR